MNIDFESTINGDKVKLKLKAENLVIERLCDTEYHIAFTELIQRGIMPKASLEKVMSDRGLWTQEQEKQLTESQQALAKLQLELDKAETHEKGLAIAKQMGDLRAKCLEIVEVKAAIFSNSAESLADAIRRDAYIAYALVYADSDKKVFKDYRDFLSRADEAVVIDARRVVLNESISAFNTSLTALPEIDYIKKVEKTLTEEKSEKQEQVKPKGKKKVTSK